MRDLDNLDVLEGGLKVMKALFVRCSNVVLSLMGIMAVVFANCQCVGRAYEPKVPKGLE